MSNYLEHFGLKQPPFSTSPDPMFVFPSREHEQALLKIAYYTDDKQGLFLLMLILIHISRRSPAIRWIHEFAIQNFANGNLVEEY